MAGIRFILALHNHQPVGNFDDVFERVYRDSYKPWLDVLEEYPELPFVLHTSGPLMEWLAERKPEYIGRVRSLVEESRVEILGGGFFEPILTMIPRRDRVGQIRDYSAYLCDLLGTKVRGMWVPERVWEQHLVSSIAEAGIEYTVLDDLHFQRAGLQNEEVFGYYFTEDEGRLLKVFPSSEPLCYLIPFQEPHATYEYLQTIASEHPGATVVFADDGEKFGSRPETHDRVYTKGWLRRFCDMLRANRDWIQLTTFSETVDSTLPLGKVYIPDGCPREMTEWTSPPEWLVAHENDKDHPAARLKPLVQPVGNWRNFKNRYPETNEMYTRMLGLSQRLADALTNADADPDYLDAARQELFRGQCNCPYWHGSFGGLYLPHLRNAIYHHLIAADNALADAEDHSGPRVAISVADFNLDARQEVCLENDQIVAFVRPATGGQIYELDVRHALTNLLNTLDCRPEPYHAEIPAHSVESPANASPALTTDRVVLNHVGHEKRIVYDRYSRKAFVDHFYSADVTLQDLIVCQEVEQGDFVQGAYLSKVQRTERRVAVVMDRIGRAESFPVRIRKTIELSAGSETLEVVYNLEELPEGVPLHFAVEINLAAMAGHANDGIYSDAFGKHLGMLDAPLDLKEQAGVGLINECLDLHVTLGWSRPAGLWCFPIETVSKIDGRFELVYQSSVLIPHWTIVADNTRRWDLRFTLGAGRVLEPNKAVAERSARDELVEAASGE